LQNTVEASKIVFNNVADGFQQKAAGAFGNASHGGFRESNSNAFGSGIGINTNTGMFFCMQ